MASVSFLPGLRPAPTIVAAPTPISTVFTNPPTDNLYVHRVRQFFFNTHNMKKLVVPRTVATLTLGYRRFVRPLSKRFLRVILEGGNRNVTWLLESQSTLSLDCRFINPFRNDM